MSLVLLHYELMFDSSRDKMVLALGWILSFSKHIQMSGGVVKGNIIIKLLRAINDQKVCK